jgi:succinate dehydrogenase/fumarate reductase-like Fe-S protein
MISTHVQDLPQATEHNGVSPEEMVPKVRIYLMGKEYHVPSVLTIMAAIEYAGYKLVRGCGCRAGFCGACSTVYRKADDYKLHSALACQTLVEDGMYLVQIPFVPAVKSVYDLEELDASNNVVLRYYPEIARCVSCNTCTKSCPQDIRVMDYVQAALRGNIARAAQLSFDCIQCGLCSSRCPADIKHYHVGQLVRRLYGRYTTPHSPSLAQRIEEIESGQYQQEFDELTSMSLDDLKRRYEQRTIEAAGAENKGGHA